MSGVSCSKAAATLLYGVSCCNGGLTIGIGYGVWSNCGSAVGVSTTNSFVGVVKYVAGFSITMTVGLSFFSMSSVLCGSGVDALSNIGVSWWCGWSLGSGWARGWDWGWSSGGGWG